MSDEKFMSIKKYDGLNWTSWSKDIQAVLIIKQSPAVWTVVKNGVRKDQLGGIVQADQDNNDIALSYIRLACEKSMQVIINKDEDAKTAYEKLKKQYESNLGVYTHKLMTDWEALRKLSAESIDAYLGRVQELAIELENVGDAKSDVSIVNAALRGMPAAFSTISSIIKNLPISEQTLDGVKHRLKEEAQKPGFGDPASQAYYVQNSFRPQSRGASAGRYSGDRAGRGGRGPQPGHGTFNYRGGHTSHTGQTGQIFTGKCNVCNRYGHKARDCSRKPGNPTVFVVDGGDSKSDIVMDSGCPHHISPNQQMFHKYKVLPTPMPIKWGGEESFTSVVGTGDLHFSSLVQGQLKQFTLKDVWHVPDAGANLFSLRLADKLGFEVSISKGKNLVSKDGQLLLEGKARVDDQYAVSVVEWCPPPPSPLVFSASPVMGLGSKAYRILVGKRMVISREVKFDESSIKHSTEVPADTFNISADKDRSVVPPVGVAADPIPPVAPLRMDQGNPVVDIDFNHQRAEHLQDDNEDFADCDEPTPSEEPASEINRTTPSEEIAAEPTTDSGLRRSTRANFGRKSDNVYNAAGSLQQKPLSKYAINQVVINLGTEPKTYEEAIGRPDASRWRAAMDEEMDSLGQNNTWTLEMLPKNGVKPIKVKWLYKIKRDEKGNVVRYKARLVAKGFMQREGVDYNEVFAPTSKHTTLRSLLSIVAADNLELHQLDIKTAFLHGELEEDIWMDQPKGYEVDGPNLACHLNKALYGLRQAPRAWHFKLKAVLEKADYIASTTDPALFIKMDIINPVYLVVWVDDILMASKDPQEIQTVKKIMASVFDITDMGEATFFLGMELERDRTAGTLKLSQRRMTEDLVKLFGMSEAKTKTTPFTCGIKLVKDGKLMKTGQYSELVGSLLYLATCTRPDVSHAVGTLSRFMSCATEEHWTAAKGVLRYLAGTSTFGIMFGNIKQEIRGYCDADYGGDMDTRRSTTGYVFLINGGAVSWNSKLQPTVAMSTTEAEYMAAASAVKDALWLRKLMADFGKSSESVKIFTDNQASLKLMKNPLISQRSKHIDIMHHFARERVERHEVNFEYVSTAHNYADILTKALPWMKFEYCRSGMSIK